MSDGDTLAKAMYDDPLDEPTRLVFSDYLEEHGQPERAAMLRKKRIPLTRLDCQAIEMLKSCNFTPGSWDKRFARDLPNDANDLTSLTPRQFIWLWLMCRRYRRQMADSLVKDHAEKVYARYKALHASEIVKPEYKPIPENDRTQEHFRKRRANLRTNRQFKEIEMPLFD